MTRLLLLALVTTVTALTGLRDAEACACCDAVTTKTVVGWNKDSTGLLVEARTNVACEPKYWLEEWKVDATTPAVCHDLSQTPAKVTACDEIQTTYDAPPTKVPTSLATTYGAPGKRLPAAQVKFETRPGKSAGETNVDVSRRVKGTWKQIASFTYDATGTRDPAVVVYPAAKSDRAMIVLSTVMNGLGNQIVETRWASLPR